MLCGDGVPNVRTKIKLYATLPHIPASPFSISEASSAGSRLLLTQTHQNLGGKTVYFFSRKESKLLKTYFRKHYISKDFYSYALALVGAVAASLTCRTLALTGIAQCVGLLVGNVHKVTHERGACQRIVEGRQARLHCFVGETTSSCNFSLQLCGMVITR